MRGKEISRGRLWFDRVAFLACMTGSYVGLWWLW